MMYVVIARNINCPQGSAVGIYSSFSLALDAINECEEGYGCKLDKMEVIGTVTYLSYNDTPAVVGSKYEIYELFPNESLNDY